MGGLSSENSNRIPATTERSRSGARAGATAEPNEQWRAVPAYGKIFSHLPARGGDGATRTLRERWRIQRNDAVRRRRGLVSAGSRAPQSNGYAAGIGALLSSARRQSALCLRTFSDWIARCVSPVPGSSSFSRHILYSE